MKTTKEGIRQFITAEITKRDMRESEAPLLLISYGPSHQKYLIYSVFENRFRHLNIPDLSGKLVAVASYGWLVLVEPESRECCLFNPISMDKIQLPGLESSYTHKKCVLSKPPTEPDCHALFIGTYSLCYCQIGDQEFTIVDYGFLGSIASFQGHIYGFEHEDIESIHFVGKNVEFRPMHIEMMDGAQFSSFQTCNTYHTWLIESPSSSSSSQLELLMVQKISLTSGIDNRKDFRVFQVDTNRRSCIELVSIGKRTIFLTNNGGGAWCCGPTIGIKPNSIYYTNYGIGDKNLNVFNLENRSVTSQPLPPRCVCPDSFISWVNKTTLFNT